MRRKSSRLACESLLAGASGGRGCLGTRGRARWRPPVSPLTITGLKVTPIALPDPPILAASGCHGPYFLRNMVELRTDGGIVGIGETHGGSDVTKVLDRAEPVGCRPERVRVSKVCAIACKR